MYWLANTRGTFAIVMPIAIPMAYHLDASLYVTIGAVLSGGLFGDHCSPVSDTTILSASGANCELMNHTWTQLPYSLLCAVVSFFGFMVASVAENVFVTVACVGVMAAAYLVLAKYKHKAKKILFPSSKSPWKKQVKRVIGLNSCLERNTLTSKLSRPFHPNALLFERC